jgi:N-methylhydantoinase B/oxoprolinase/acetone carboxylase alpha subunit
VLAQGADSLWNTQITGQREDGDPFTYVFFSGGGMGARPTGDGLSATAFPSGIRGVPAEVIESISPVVMHKRELRPDSEGPGRYRGGFGQEMEIGVRSSTPWTLSAMYDRTRCSAQGICGGSSGATGTVRTSDGRDLHPKRQQRIGADERVILTRSRPGSPRRCGRSRLGRACSRVLRGRSDGDRSARRAHRRYRSNRPFARGRLRPSEERSMRGAGHAAVEASRAGAFAPSVL